MFHNGCVTVKRLLVFLYAFFCERTWNLFQQLSYLPLFYVLKQYFRTLVLDLCFTTVARLSNVYLWIYMHAVVKGIETSLYAAPFWNYRNPENLQTENWKKKQHLFWIPSLVFFLWLCVFRGLERPRDQNGKPPNFNHSEAFRLRSGPIYPTWERLLQYSWFNLPFNSIHQCNSQNSWK